MPATPESRRRTRSRELLLKLGVFLLLGVVVNIAVAWGFLAVWSLPTDPPDETAAKSLTSRDVWMLRRWDRHGLCYTESGLWNVAGGHKHSSTNPYEVVRPESRISNIELDHPQVEAQIEWEIMSGWPKLSMAGLKRNEFQNSLETEILHSAVLVGPSRAGQIWSSVQDFRAMLLPLRPLWPGFAINTIFYAALLWVLFCGPGKIRRLVRIRRGCCPACGYQIAPGIDSRMSDKCSECGGVLPLPLREGGSEGSRHVA